MKHYIPDVYKEFNCAADKCPDTCCKDWEIVIDEETESFYKSVRGNLGEMLNDNIVTDSDGDRIFLLNEKKECPFLDKERLCMLQKEYGEKALCKTCFEYPKLSFDFTEFTEYALSFACPEAVRLVMKSGSYSFPDTKPIENDDNGYSKEVMNFLIAARKKTAEIFLSPMPYKTKLSNALAFNEYVQELLYCEDTDISLLSDVEFELPEGKHCDNGFVFELVSRLDIMDKEFLCDIQKARNSRLIPDEKINDEFVKLSLYYLHRYYLNAIADEDVLSCVKSIFCAYAVISSLTAYYHAENDFDRRVLIYEKYSREIEHSFENVEVMKEAYYSDSDFSSINLINTLF